MIISLNPDWRIRSDPLQWIVEKRCHNAKAKYHQWEIKGYFNMLAGAVMSVLESQVRSIEGNYPWTALEPLLDAISAMRERVSESLKDFRHDPPANPYGTSAKARATLNRRGARKKDATPPWLTDRQNQEIISIYKEAARLSVLTRIKHHVDHIIPLKGENVCGLHVPWNLRPLPASENLSKHNRVLAEDLKDSTNG